MDDIIKKTDEEPLPSKDRKVDIHEGNVISADSVKSRGAFSKLKRELSDEDLNSPGTQRLILNELDKYEECSKLLEEYKTKYYKSETSRAVLEERANTSDSFEILYSASLSFGAMLVGLTPSLIDKAVGWFVGAFTISIRYNG